MRTFEPLTNQTMNDKQYEQQGSFLKSEDFLDDNVDNEIITSITQIPPLHTALKAHLADITVADGIGSQNNKGYGILKANRRAELILKIMKVSRGAKALYIANDDVVKESKVSFAPSDFNNYIPEKLYAVAKRLSDVTAPDKTNLINTAEADHTAVMTAANTFFAVATETKDAIELSKINNALIDPLLAECREIRRKLDAFMQTLIDEHPLLYAEWKETLSIDNNPTANPPAYFVNVTVQPGEFKNVDYAAFAIQNNSEIKLINNNAAPIEFGFGPTDASFSGAPTIVAANSQQRKTAVSLNYQSIEQNNLNIKNSEDVEMEVTLEFYTMG